MSDTEVTIRRPEPAAEFLAASTLRDTYYRPLVRLAALLTGDADTAEAVVCEVLAGLRSRSPLGAAASEDVLRSLQRCVLVRSRRIRIPAGSGGTGQARADAQSPVTACQGGSPTAARARQTAEFAQLPVVRALQELPRRGREAIVLTYYLDLTEQQAALVAGVTPAALRRFLSEAMRTVNDRFFAA